MNKTKIRETAEALLTAKLATRKKGELIGYNQNTFGSRDYNYSDKTGHSCGTTACIAGWVSVLNGKGLRGDVSGRAQKILGINNAVTSELFGGECTVGFIPSNKDAALVLFHLAETGRVDWSLARQ